MRLIVLLVLLGACGVAVWILTWSPPVAPVEQFQAALSAYEAGDPKLLPSAIQQLAGDVEYAQHRQLLEAVLAITESRPDVALQRLGALPQDGLLRPEILRFAGESLFRLDRLPEAEAVFRTLANEQPDLPSAHRWLAMIYYDLGANDAAIVELTRLTELEPDDFRPHRLMALMYRDFELFSDAIRHYERVLELGAPSDVEAEVRIELAKSLVALRRYDEALAVLGDEPESAAAKVVAAQCHWSSHREDAARALLASANKDDATIRESLLLQADILSADDDPTGALEVMRSAVDLYPHDAECRYRLALLLEENGFSDEALVEMAVYEEKQALAARLTELNTQALQEPRNAELREEIADLCETLGKVELARMWREAARVCREGAELFPLREPVATE